MAAGMTGVLTASIGVPSNSAASFHCEYANFSAMHTSFASIDSNIDQLTMRRLAKSMTTARYNYPSFVAM